MTRRYVSRSLSRRVSPSSTLSTKQTVQHVLAECIMSRDTSFAACMMATHALDVHGNASARARHAVAVAKVVSPRCVRTTVMHCNACAHSRDVSAGLLWRHSMLPFKFMGRRACVLIKCWLRCKWDCACSSVCLKACVGYGFARGSG